MKKIACILARVSRIEQDLKSQIDSLKKDAEKHLKLKVKEEYIFQEHITGLDSYDKEERESLAALKQCIEDNVDKQFFCFMWELTRLSRNPWYLLEQLNWFNHHKVPIYFHDIEKWTMDINTLQEIDETSNIIFGAATYGKREVEKITMRTSRGRDAKAEKGYYVGHLSDGFMVEITREGKKIIEDKERSPIIKRVFKLYIEGNSTDRIADILNSEKIPTANAYRAQSEKFGHKSTYHLPFDKKATKKREEAQWAGTHIGNILTNEWYIGVRRYHDDVYEIEDKIIDKETWERVKAIREERAVSFRANRKTKHLYLLSNLLICGNCQKKLYGHYTGLNNHYYCSSVDEGNKCGLRGVCKENIEGIVFDAIKRHMFSSDSEFIFDYFKPDKKEVSKVKRTINENKGIISKFEKEIEISLKLISNYARLQAKALDDEIMANTYKNLLSEERKKHDALQLKIKDLNNENVALAKKITTITDTEDRWSKVFNLKDNLGIMKDFFHALITRIEVDNLTSSITLLNIEYINGKSDIILYSPRLLKTGYIQISEGIINRHSCIGQSKHIEKRRKIEYCKEDKMFHFDGCLSLYVDKYELVDSWEFGMEKVKRWNFETIRSFQSPLSIDSLVRALQYSCYIMDYHRLEDISEEGKVQQEKYKIWRKKYNTGKPKNMPYVVKDADYDNILKEKKHLYNRTYKIKKNKRLSEDEKKSRLEEVKERIAQLSAQVKYIKDRHKP